MYLIKNMVSAQDIQKVRATAMLLQKKRAKRDEWYGQLDYKYSKKLNFMAWYAAAKDKKDGEKFKQDRIRFEAKYSF